MKKAFIISHIPDFKGWKTCFQYVMEKSDSFKIIFQGDKNTLDTGELNAGKKEFLALPFTSVSPYKGMENSIEVTGELSKAAQELFWHFMSPSFGGYKPELWSFQLFSGKDVTLRVEDFSLAILFLEESEVAYLSSKGIDTQNMLETDMHSISGDASF